MQKKGLMPELINDIRNSLTGIETHAEEVAPGPSLFSMVTETTCTVTHKRCLGIGQ